MTPDEFLLRVAELRRAGLPADQVDTFLGELELDQALELEAVADEYQRLNDVLAGLAHAVDEFQGLGTSALAERRELLHAARTRFAIQMSALLSEDEIPLDTLGGSASLSTSLHLFRDNLRAVATRMGTLVEQTIEDSGLRKELELAGAVQQMLVSQCDGARISDLRAYCWYEPAEQCAGDLFMISPLGDGDALALLGDATGHGAPAAIVAAVVKGACELARQGMRGALRPFQLLRMLNRVLVESVRGEYLMTCVAARYRVDDQMMSVANAGHRAVWLIRDGELRTFSGTGDPPLGARPVYRYEQQQFKVEPGDRVVLYTDGIPEGENPQGQEFGERRLRDVVLSASKNGSAAIITAVREELERHLDGGRANDDLTLVVLEVAES